MSFASISKQNGTNLLDFFIPSLLFQRYSNTGTHICHRSILPEQMQPISAASQWHLMICRAAYFITQKARARKPDRNQTMFYCCCICDCLALFGAIRFLRDWLDYFYSSKCNTYNTKTNERTIRPVDAESPRFPEPTQKVQIVVMLREMCVCLCVLKQENFRKSKKINQQHLHKQTGKLSELRECSRFPICLICLC